MSKLLGTAVGVALQNHEAIRQVGAPALNAVGNGFKVIWNTFWKTALLSMGSIVVWLAATITTRYAAPQTPIFATPIALALFAVFLFLVLPTVVFIRESVMMRRKVRAARGIQPVQFDGNRPQQFD